MEEFSEYDIRYTGGNKGDAETSLTALEELAQKDKKLFRRIIDAVKRFISSLKNHNTNASVVRDLRKLESRR